MRAGGFASGNGNPSVDAGGGFPNVRGGESEALFALAVGRKVLDCMKYGVTALVLTIEAIIYVAMCARTSCESSCTFDEAGHLLAGYVKLTENDHRFFPESPPLGQLAAALPLRFMEVAPPRLSARGREWEESDVWEISRRWTHVDQTPMRLLIPARMGITALGLLLGALVVGVAARLARPHGRTAAVIAGGVFALSPTMIAHGSLVTTDLAAGLGIFAATIAGAAYFERPTWVRGLIAGAASGLAMQMKYTFAIAVPGLIACAIWRMLRSVTSEENVPEQTRNDGERVAGAILGAAFGAAAFLVVTWACYGFRFNMVPDGVPYRPYVHASARPADPWEWALNGSGFGGQMAKKLKDWRVVPEAFAWGLAYAARSGQEFQSYLFGRKFDGAVWFYFPVIFVFKTSIWILVMLVIVAVRVVLPTRDRAARLHTGAFPSTAMFVVASYGLLAVFGSYNIGHRHLLPIYPFLYVAVAVGSARIWAGNPPRVGLLHRGALASIAVAYATGTLSSGTNQLGRFSEILISPTWNAWAACGSHLDWGQDMIKLARRMHVRNWPKINLSYYGTGDPAAYGVQANYFVTPRMPEGAACAELTPGTYALSASCLWMTSWNADPGVQRLHWDSSLAARYTGLARQRSAKFDTEREREWDALRGFRLITALRKRQPDDFVGASIFVFVLNQSELDELLAPDVP